MRTLRAKIHRIYCENIFDASLIGSPFDGLEHRVFAQCNRAIENCYISLAREMRPHGVRPRRVMRVAA